MDNARRAQNGKKNDVQQAAPIPRQRNTGEESRDQPDRNEGQESKNLVTGVESFELGEFEHIAQAIGVQVEKGHGEINRREAQAVNDKQRGELRPSHRDGLGGLVEEEAGNAEIEKELQRIDVEENEEEHYAGQEARSGIVEAVAPAVFVMN